MNHFKPIPPVIKWTGSKGPVMPSLAGIFPRFYKRFFDPFVGGGSSIPYGGMNEHRVIAGDILPELVELWKEIKSNSSEIKSVYREMWGCLKEDPGYYYVVRDQFNRTRDPFQLFFLTRTAYSGLVRFNANNEFNTSLHFGRDGIQPDRLDKVVDMWERKYLHLVDFVCGDYRETLGDVDARDFVFLDPPYVGTKGQYQIGSSSFDYLGLIETLRKLNDVGAMWMLTLGGNDDDIIPGDIYMTKMSTRKTSSSLGRLKKSDSGAHDVVYVNYSI